MNFSSARLAFLGAAGLLTALTACSVGGTDDPNTSTETRKDEPSCSDRQARADALYQPAYAAAVGDGSCATDDDCTVALLGTNCESSCPQVTSVSAVANLSSTVDQIDSDPNLCGNFFSDCPDLVRATSCPDVVGAVCTAGRCTAGIPAAWTAFAVSHQIGPSWTDPFPACDTDDGCGEWDVTVAGAMTVNLSGVTHTAALSASDLATVDAIIRRAATTDPSTVCAQYAPSVTTETYALSVTRSGAAPFASSITGCIVGGPSVPTNDMSTLVAILAKY